MTQHEAISAKRDAYFASAEWRLIEPLMRTDPRTVAELTFIAGAIAATELTVEQMRKEIEQTKNT